MSIRYLAVILAMSCASFCWADNLQDLRPTHCESINSNKKSQEELTQGTQVQNAIALSYNTWVDALHKDCLQQLQINDLQNEIKALKERVNNEKSITP